MASSTPRSKGKGKSPAYISPTRPSYGIVPEAERELPSNYITPQAEIREMDAETVHEDGNLALTTQPGRNFDEFIKDHPDGWTECLVSGYVKRQIVSYPGFPKPLLRPSKTLYELRQTPSSGLGMFALEDIEPGDLILSERPLLLAPAGIRSLSDIPTNFTLEQQKQAAMKCWNDCLEVAVKRMDPSLRKAYMSLANSHTQDGSGAVLGIMRTNGFAAGDLSEPDLGPQGAYSMVGNDASRVNHSCSPNVVINLERATFGMELRAVRKIRKGEEMTTQYCLLKKPRANRQKKLLPYGFHCSCVACSDAGSDARRRAIFSGPLCDPIPGSVSLKDSLKHMRFIENEGLESAWQYIAILQCVAKAYGKAGNQEKEKEFRRKVYLHALGRDGRTGAMAAIMF